VSSNFTAEFWFWNRCDLPRIFLAESFPSWDFDYLVEVGDGVRDAPVPLALGEVRIEPDRLIHESGTDRWHSK
jgi:hypothetical protein